MKNKSVTIRSVMNKTPITKTGATRALPSRGYRTLAQLFLEDFGIQLNEASGEWWRLEQNPVVNTELLDNLEHDLYYYITAGGSYGGGDVRLPLKDTATGEVIVPEGWTGPFTDVVWWDCDVEGIVHEFRLYCYTREPYHATQKSVFLTRNTSDPALFATQVAGSTPEQEPETAPELEPTADPMPTPAPTPPAPKSALREVYETLSPRQLCTVVGLRTLLAKQQGITKKEARKQLNGVLKALSDIATLSGRSEIYGFGCFKAKTTKMRTVKSHLGSYSGSYTLPKTTKSVFKPGKALKEKMSLVTGKTYEQIITALESLDAVKTAKAAVRKAARRGAKRAIAPKAAGKKTGR